MMALRLACLWAFAATSAFAGVVAPVPRGIEFPKPSIDGDDPQSEDPAAIVERIAKTAEGIGERLKDKDTGNETLEKQEQLLKDIDKLLKPPPPMDGSGGGGSSSNPPPPSGGEKNGGMPPPMGGNPGMPPPMGGNKPRPQRTGSRPEPTAGTPKPMPMGMGNPDLGEPSKTGSNTGANPMGKPSGNAALPLEDPFTKQIWGHLPERLRQQASQYYREQYMPKYGELLKLYYSNLAEREKK
jgi:hypothetical protein